MKFWKNKCLQRLITLLLATVFMISSFGVIQPYEASALDAQETPPSFGTEDESVPPDGEAGETLQEAPSTEENSVPADVLPAAQEQASSSGPENEEIPLQFVVRFLDYSGSVIGEPQTVPANGAATAPEQAPEPPEEKFIGWDTDAYLCVQADLDVAAVYEPSMANEPLSPANAGAPRYIWTDHLSLSTQSKRYGDPDPRHIVVGLPDGLKEGVDYEVSFGRIDEGEEVREAGYGVKITSFRFLNPAYELVGDKRWLGTGLLHIQPRAVIITARNLSKTYDGTPLTLAGERPVSGDEQFAPGDVATVYLSGSQTNVGFAVNKIEWATIKNSSGQDVMNNYDVTLVDGTLSVTHASLTIRADNKTINYGDNKPDHTIGYTGFVNGETSAVLRSQPTVSCTYKQDDLPGAYTITVSGAAADNYSITYQPGTCTVRANSRQITVTAGSDSKVYDGLPLTKNSYTVDGFEDYEDDFILTATVSGSVKDVAQSGSANNLVTGVEIRRISDNSDVTTLFSNIVKVPGALTVTPAPLEAWMQSQTIHFGAPVPASFPVEYTGFVNGENESVLTRQTTASCTYVQGAAPGPYTVTGSGAQAPNYTFHYLSGALMVNHNSTPITVTAATDSKVYDGKSLVNNTCTVSGLPAGYTLYATVSGSVTGVKDTTAGNNKVSNVSIVRDSDKADVTGYFSNVVPVNGTLSIRPKDLVIDALDHSVSYGSPAPVYDLEYIGFVNEEDSSVLAVQPVTACSYTQGDAPDSYSITLSDAQADNYSISYRPGVLTVTASSTHITVKAGNAGKPYDGAVLTNSSYTVLGLPDGYVLEATVTGAAVNVGDTHSGNNAVTDYIIKTNPGGQDVTEHFPNVQLVPGTLSIQPVLLTAKAKDFTIEIDEEVPVFAIEYEGFIPRENEDALSSPAVAACSYKKGDGSGSYDITLSGAQADNYTIHYQSGVLMVGPDTSLLVIRAASQSKVYDGLPLTKNAYTLNGTLPSGYTMKVWVSGTATKVADNIPGNNEVTKYTIYDGNGDDATHEFSNVVVENGNLTIRRRTLIVETENTSVAFGEDAPAYTIQYSGFAPGENADSALNGTHVAFSDYQAGDIPQVYLIEVNGGVTADNYNMTYFYGGLTVRNNHTPIRLVAKSASKRYDGKPLEKPDYTQYGALPDGFSLNVPVSGKATNVADGQTGNNVIGGVTVVRDLDKEDVTQYFSGITREDGTLIITPAPLTATMESAPIPFGSPIPAYSAVYSGFVNGENASVLTSETVFTCSYQQGDPPEVYEIKGSGAAAANYAITYQSGSLRVTPNYANIVITAASKGKVYDGEVLSDNTFAVTGLPDGYTVTATVEGSATNAGDEINRITGYLIRQDNGGADVSEHFQNVTKVNGTLSVTPASLVAQMENATVEYNEAPPVYKATYSGFVTGEGEEVLTSPATGASSYQLGSTAGQYSITGSDAAANNYTISYLPGTLTVTTQDDQIIVAAGSASKQYDGTPLSADAYTIEGLPANLRAEVTVSGEVTTVADSAEGNNQVTRVAVFDGEKDVTSNFPNIVRVPGTLNITPAPLFISMEGKNIEFGASAPVYTASYQGFVNDEDPSVLARPFTAASTYRKGDSPGSYPITGSGAQAPNYSINYQSGMLVVTTKDTIITVEASSASKVYDSEPLSCSDCTFNGLPEGYTLEVATTGSITHVRESAPDGSVPETEDSLPGYNMVSSVTVRNDRGDDVTSAFPNIITIPGRLAVTPREVMIIAENTGKEEGETDPPLSARAENVVPGESLNYTLGRAEGEETGVYSIDVYSGENPNYRVIGVPGMFTIRQAGGDAERFIIQSTAGPGGAISPAGQTDVAKGGSASFSWIPDEGYIVDRVLVDGEVVATNGSSYTFDDVRDNHSIHVVFITPAAAAARGGTVQTGDRGNLWIWAVLASFSGAALLLQGAHVCKKRVSR